MTNADRSRRAHPGSAGRGVVLGIWLALAGVGLAGCGESDDDSSVDRAQARVAAKERAVAEAESEFTAASEEFCGASKTYIVALDRYGDVLDATAPTVGDVKDAGSDLAAPGDDAQAAAEAAVEAHQDLVVAEQELADAQEALEQAKATSTASPSGSPTATPTPPVPTATVDRVKRAESEFADAQSAVTDQTPLAQASTQFNAAVVALEMAWLRLFADAGCLTDAEQEAEAAVRAYTTTLQQALTETGYYNGDVDGVYGPETVEAVEALQQASQLPVTGAVDKATAAALQAEQLAQGGAAAQQAVAQTAAVQQTLALTGFWDGPVDGVWTPALTEAVKAFQSELGVEPTGSVDVATVRAFESAIAASEQPATPSSSAPAPSVSPPSTDQPRPTPSPTGP